MGFSKATLLKKAKKQYLTNAQTYNSILEHAKYYHSQGLGGKGFPFFSFEGDEEIMPWELMPEEVETGKGGANQELIEVFERYLRELNQKIPSSASGKHELQASSEMQTPEEFRGARPIVLPTYQQSPILRFEGPLPTAPINIVAKNYIQGGSEIEGEVGVHRSKVTPMTKSIALTKIPDKLLKASKTDWEPVNYRGVRDSYFVIEDRASISIFYDESVQKLVYKISEPELTKEESQVLEELKRAFIYVFEKFSPTQIEISEEELVRKGVSRLCSKYRIKLSDESMNKIVYFLQRDFMGLELIEPIMHDPHIEDISCDGLNIPIFVNHLKYGALEVNRQYTDANKLNSFIVKLAQKSNQEISLSKPILQGALTDGSRVEAIYGKEVSGKGSSFTIRKFRAEPFTPVHLIDLGTMPPMLLSYLWLAVENKQSILVSGGTATGKTTILNALSLFAPPASKIISIEDTPEINLPHEHWLPLIARESEGRSEVTMFDLLKASLRERPDYIIVGEIRGSEAAILFQGMATGHAGLGTVHANKFEDLVNRMTIKPINLPKQLLTEANIILFARNLKVKENIVRRIISVIELMEYDASADKFLTNEFLTFNPATDTFSFKEDSYVMSNLMKTRGGKAESLWTEIEKRRRILVAMHRARIVEYKEVAHIIQVYYKSPQKIFDYIEEYIGKRNLSPPSKK